MKSSYRHYYTDPRNTKPIPVWAAVIAVLVAFGVMGFVIYEAMKSDTSNWPEVVSVEVADDYPVSLKDAEFYRDESDGNYELLLSEVPYKFRVTMSDGKEYIVPGPIFSKTKLDSHDGIIEVDTAVSYGKCSELIKSGIDTVDVNVQVTIKQNIVGTGFKGNVVETFNAVVEKKLVPCIVKNIVHLSDESFAFYDYSDFDAISGEKFEITYYDDTVKTVEATIGRDVDGFYENYIDGHPVSVCYYEYSDAEMETEMVFLDSRTYFPCIVKESDFDSIEVTNCLFDQAGEPVRVEFAVTEKDGTVSKISSEDFHYYEGSKRYLAATHKGNYIYFSVKNRYSGLFSDIKKEVTVFYGFNDYSHTACFSPAESDCDCICHNNNSVARLVYFLSRFLSKILSVYEVCDCGINHY